MLTFLNWEFIQWIEIQMKILSDAFKNIFILRSFVEDLWFGLS